MIKVNIPRVSQQLSQIEDAVAWKRTLDEDLQVSGVAISGEDLAGEDFYKLDLCASRFEKNRFINCDFEKTSFVDVVFENCDFSNSRFSMAYFHRCEFHNCKCLGTIFQDAVLKHVRILNCKSRCNPSDFN